MRTGTVHMCESVSIMHKKYTFQKDTVESTCMQRFKSRAKQFIFPTTKIDKFEWPTSKPLHRNNKTRPGNQFHPKFRTPTAEDNNGQQFTTRSFRPQPGLCQSRGYTLKPQLGILLKISTPSRARSENSENQSTFFAVFILLDFLCCLNCGSSVRDNYIIILRLGPGFCLRSPLICLRFLGG